MKILLSAFSCDPDQGSEPGVGWAWACELAKAGNEVWVLTREHNRALIESRLSAELALNLEFIHFGVRGVPRMSPGLGVYPYYFLWQLKAYFLAKRLLSSGDFDCVHHITYGSYRTPFFLSLLPVPAIFGPVGGGETTPLRLIPGLSSRGRVQEVTRRIVNFISSLNPITWLVWHYSALILVTTDATLKMIPSRYRRKARVLPAVTTPTVAPGERPQFKGVVGRCRALFVGRLLEWKGLHLAIQALVLASHTPHDISLGIRGNGKCENSLRKLVARKGVDSMVEWIPRSSGRNEVLEIYDRYDVLVFPSFHDSGGTVVLEALSRGLPVICLDLGGPGTLVNSDCGAAICAERQSEADIVQAIADELIRFASMSETESEEVRKRAKERANHFVAGEVVGKAYEWFEELSPSRAA